MIHGAIIQQACQALSGIRRCLDLAGADLAGADLTSADLTSADLTGANLDDAIGIRLPGMPDPALLRAAVADHIEKFPDLHRQDFWGDGRNDPSCQTPCCVAGWACHLGGGTYGMLVRQAAEILLHVPRKPMPGFEADVSRESILQALRA